VVVVHFLAYLKILKGTPHYMKVLANLEKFGTKAIKDQWAKVILTQVWCLKVKGT
jgi:hypothetical protein